MGSKGLIMKDTYPFKYGELLVAARNLAHTVKEDIRLDAKGPYAFAHNLALAQANAIQELIVEHEKRGK